MTGVAADAVPQPVPRWDRPPPPPRPWYLLPLLLAILALLSGCVLGFGNAVDGQVAARVPGESVRVVATITRIRVRDDLVRPSLLTVALPQPVAGRRVLVIRTDQEEVYRVGERVPVDDDLRHPGLSAVAGDANGPTWTLGAELLGLFGAVLLLLAAVITAAVGVAAERGRRQWTTSADRASGHGLVGPPPPGIPPTLAPDDPQLRRAIDTWCRGAVLGAVARLGAAAGGVGLVVWAPGRSSLVRDGSQLLGVLLVAGSAPFTRRVLAGRRAVRRWVARPGPWRPATALLVRTWSGPALLVATDAAHAGLYRFGVDPVLATDAARAGPYRSGLDPVSDSDARQPASRPFPVWVSAGRDGALALTDAGGAGLVAAWLAPGAPRWSQRSRRAPGPRSGRRR